MGLMLSLKNMMLGADYEDDDDFLEEDDFEYDEESKKGKQKLKDDESRASKRTSRDSNVLSLPKTNIVDGSNDIIISHPKSTADASIVCSKFKDGAICIVNLEGREKEIAQRIADILSGAAYVLEGNIERITNNVFVMAPKLCAVSNELKEQIKSNGFSGSIFPWLSSVK